MWPRSIRLTSGHLSEYILLQAIGFGSAQLIFVAFDLVRD
jgi:hypothetical protein